MCKKITDIIMTNEFNNLIHSIKSGEVKKLVCYQDTIIAYSNKNETRKIYISHRDQIFNEIYQVAKVNDVHIEMKEKWSLFSLFYNGLKLLSLALFVFIVIEVYSFVYARSSCASCNNNNFNVENNLKDVKIFLDPSVLHEVDAIVDYYNNPHKYQNIDMTKGVLFYGKPGTGKTLIAKYIAKNANAKFIQLSASSLESKWVGESAQNIIRLFQHARTLGKVVIFFDEIDAIGKKRSSDNGHHAQILNQLLAELDGFKDNKDILFIGATNRKDDLDEALLRGGRLDLHIEIPYPKADIRQQILKHYLSLYPYVENDMNTLKLSYILSRSSPADIANIVRQASIIAAKKNSYLNNEILTEAIDKVRFGVLKEIPISDKREIKAYNTTVFHELGHAFMIYYYDVFKIYKISAKPRGDALGWVSCYSDYDITNMTREEYNYEIQVGLAGYIMEEIIEGASRVSSGPVSDLRQVQDIARKMIKTYGFGKNKLVHLYNYVDGQYVSEEEKKSIDNQVKLIIDENYAKAKEILQNNLHIIKRVHSVLLKEKELTGEEFYELIKSIKK